MSYSGLDGLHGARSSGSAGGLPGAEAPEFEYPVPLFVKNTFIDAQIARPASLEGFIHERQAFSCPTSLVSEPGSDCDGVGAIAPLPKLMPYCPGEHFKKCAAYGSSAPLAMYPIKPGGKAPAPAPVHALDQDAQSECSTTDTMARAPPSPALETALAPGAADAATGARASLPKQDAAAAPTKLAELPAPLESPPLPSAGSAGHDVGQCKPCAFMHTKGCSSGADCQFCHLCGPGEKQRRQKEKRMFFGSMRQLQKMAASALAGGPAPDAGTHA